MDRSDLLMMVARTPRGHLTRRVAQFYSLFQQGSSEKLVTSVYVPSFQLHTYSLNTHRKLIPHVLWPEPRAGKFPPLRFQAGIKLRGTYACFDRVTLARCLFAATRRGQVADLASRWHSR